MRKLSGKATSISSWILVIRPRRASMAQPLSSHSGIPQSSAEVNKNLTALVCSFEDINAKV